MEKHGLDMRGYIHKATCKGSYGGKLAQCVSWPCKALVNRGRLIKIATFSTWDLQEQCCKSYVASYRANKELVIS